MPLSEIQIMDPWIILVIIPIIFILMIILGRTFIKFRDPNEREEFNKSKRIDKTALILTRTIIILLLLMALASPYTLKTIERKGAPSLTILVDQSASFSLFDQSIVQDLKQKLGSEIPVTVRTLDYGNSSALGNGIRNNLQGNDNILLVTDGYNNKGWDLGDAILFAKERNSHINAIEIKPKKSDAAVVVYGPNEVIKQTENEFFAEVTATDSIDYQIRVIVDSDEVLKTIAKGPQTFKFNRILQEGDHKITAIINAKDSFENNNIFYKTVRALPRPKLLFVSEQNSPMFNLLDEVYEVTQTPILPGRLSDYHAIIINDIAEDKLSGDVETLINYLEDGNGLIYVGGDKSFEYNDVCRSSKLSGQCQFQNLLPVKIGYAGTEEVSGVNVVLVIDMSGSSGEKFSTTLGSEKSAVEKALAIEILKNLNPEDNVAVVSFNTDYRYVSKLSPLTEKPELNMTIANLKYGGGTIVSAGLAQAFSILKGSTGSKYVLLISDGITDLPENAMQLSKTMAQQGIKVFAVGVGENTNSQFMQGIAENGNGVYFQPTETQKIKLAIGEGKDKEKETKKYKLQILNANAFITTGIDLKASITGFNQVVPKSSGRTLVTTEFNNPVLSIWRFGLGRVAVLSTDDGSKWSGELLSSGQSKIITRTVNWAVGDPDRLKDYAVKISDTTLGEPTELKVITDKTPVLKGYEFAKIEEGSKDSYVTTYTPTATGFFRVLDATVAVSYPYEYQKVGFNQELKSIIESGGGSIFKPEQTKEIVERVKQDSVTIEKDYNYYRWPFVVAALAIFLIEIAFRRYREGLLYNKSI